MHAACARPTLPWLRTTPGRKATLGRRMPGPAAGLGSAARPPNGAVTPATPAFTQGCGCSVAPSITQDAGPHTRRCAGRSARKRGRRRAPGVGMTPNCEEKAAPRHARSTSGLGSSSAGCGPAVQGNAGIRDLFMRRERRPASAVDCSTALPAQASSVLPLGKRQAHAQQQQISFPHKRQCAWVPAGLGSQCSELFRASNAAPAATPASGCQSASMVPWPAERRQGSDQPRCARGFANLDHAPQPAARRLPLASAGPSQYSSAGSGGAVVPPDAGTRRSSAASAAAFTWPGTSTGVAGEPLAVSDDMSPDSSARSASTAAAPGVAAPLSAVSCPPAQAWPGRAPATALPGPAARPAVPPAAARRPATRLRLSLSEWVLPCSVVQARSCCCPGAAARARPPGRAKQQGSPLCPLLGERGAVARMHGTLRWQGRLLERTA